MNPLEVILPSRHDAEETNQAYLRGERPGRWPHGLNHLAAYTAGTVVTYRPATRISIASAISLAVSGSPGLDDHVSRERTGFLTTVGDAEALATRVITLLERRAIAQAMGVTARDKVESQHTTRHMVAAPARIVNPN